MVSDNGRMFTSMLPILCFGSKRISCSGCFDAFTDGYDNKNSKITSSIFQWKFVRDRSANSCLNYSNLFLLGYDKNFDFISILNFSMNNVISVF